MIRWMAAMMLAGACWASWGFAQVPVAPSPAGQAARMPAGNESLPRRSGSLLRAQLGALRDEPIKVSSVSLVAVPEPKPKTLKKHDLVTIIVREESAFNTTGTTDLKKSADIDARIQEWIKLNLSNFAIEGGAQGDNPPAIAAKAARNFKGDATVDQSDSMTTRIAAEVVDVKPNNTFIVQARKTLKVDEEEQEYVLTGVCRAEDVTVDNTVLSTQVYDLKMEKNTRGAVRDTTKRGWVPKILDWINPF